MSPGVCTCGGSGSHLRNTELGKSTIFTPSNKQAYELGDWDWHIYTTMYKKDNLSYSTGNSTLGSLVTYRGRKFKNKAVRMFMYGWFTLLNSGNWHHGVKQFYFNFKKKKKVIKNWKKKKLKYPKAFKRTVKEKKKKNKTQQACSLTQRKILPYPSRLLTTNPALRNKTDKQWSGPCILGITW